MKVIWKTPQKSVFKRYPKILAISTFSQLHTITQHKPIENQSINNNKYNCFVLFVFLIKSIKKKILSIIQEFVLENILCFKYCSIKVIGGGHVFKKKFNGGAVAGVSKYN